MGISGRWLGNGGHHCQKGLMLVLWNTLVLKRVSCCKKIRELVSWHIIVIPVFWEVEAGGLGVQAQPGHLNNLAGPNLKIEKFLKAKDTAL